ncbi:hypothetical protein DLAC_05775 [Tieghemostelium lacteum]|uniref:J domain-containing protein n=1 Tax=Tieghemostelium lacteum TaxID=361077 RepID=A0A151ZGP4_TIELA|nr:hypothetical protein DLAC_05775 [Tieghemostelium lacteum]|eukprot:KYQ93142.1 hypothetical protein DLAC_05775 [Tieghemostelium lacteum]
MNEQYENIRNTLLQNRYPKLYEILRVEPTASLQNIRDSYKKLSLEKHPDRGGTSEEMSSINNAYQILSDPNKRQVYDMLGTTFNIDDFAEAHKISKYIGKYFPLWFRIYLETKSNIKDIIMQFASNSIEKSSKIGFWHVGGFSIVHFLVEDKVTRELNKRDSKQHLNIYIGEIIATLIAAPFEIAAYRAFKKEFTISHFSNYFIFDKKMSIARLLLANVTQYRSYFSSSWKHILAMVAFRVMFSMAHFGLGYLSDYFNHRYMLTVPSKKPFIDAEDIDSEDSNVDTIDLLPQGNNTWLYLSKVTRVASYILPCMAFSIYRFWDKIDNPQSVKYWDIALIKSGVTEGAFMYASEQALLGVQKVVNHIKGTIQGFINLIVN